MISATTQFSHYYRKILASTHACFCVNGFICVNHLLRRWMCKQKLDQIILIIVIQRVVLDLLFARQLLAIFFCYQLNVSFTYTSYASHTYTLRCNENVPLTKFRHQTNHTGTVSKVSTYSYIIRVYYHYSLIYIQKYPQENKLNIV